MRERERESPRAMLTTSPSSSSVEVKAPTDVQRQHAVATYDLSLRRDASTPASKFA